MTVGTAGLQANSIQPNPHLTYRGGKILKNPKFVNLYLGSYWSSNAKGKADANYLDGFSKYLMTSPHTSIWKEYGSKKGTFLGSTFVSLPKTTRRIDDRDLQSIIEKQISTGQVKKEDGETVYTVFLPPGVVLADEDVTSLDGMGGYHGSYQGPRNKPVYYAGIAYSDKRNGINFDDVSKDNITITASHEWTEAITDPNVNKGTLGWYDDTYGEVGDIPINLGLPLKDVYGRLGGYAVQKEWSNKDHTVELESQKTPVAK